MLPLEVAGGIKRDAVKPRLQGSIFLRIGQGLSRAGELFPARNRDCCLPERSSWR
jgi:hypothetical protein